MIGNSIAGIDVKDKMNNGTEWWIAFKSTCYPMRWT